MISPIIFSIVIIILLVTIVVIGVLYYKKSKELEESISCPLCEEKVCPVCDNCPLCEEKVCPRCEACPVCITCDDIIEKVKGIGSLMEVPYSANRKFENLSRIYKIRLDEIISAYNKLLGHIQ